MPGAGPARPRITKNTPKQVPAVRASATVRGLTRRSPGARLTRAIATTAHTAPTRAGVEGVPSRTSPTTSGTTAVVTAVTGANTDIAPCDRPW